MLQEYSSTTHPPLHVWPDEVGVPMTIGIGVLGGSADFAILASDMRATYPRSAVDPNDFVGKQSGYDDIPRFESVVCSIAGRLGVTHDVESQLALEFKKLSRKKKIFREHVQNAIDKARIHELRRRYDWALKVNFFGLSCSQLLRGKLPQGKLDREAIKAAEAVCDAYEFPVELIIGGFVDGEPLLFKATGKEHIQGESSPAVYVIGSLGKVAAMDHLNRRGQNIEYSLARSVFHVHEAMEAARVADPDQYIGTPAWYVVILRAQGVWRIDPRAPLLADWVKLYQNRQSTAPLDDEIPNAEIRKLLRQ
jgi:hypothetical protein